MALKVILVNNLFKNKTFLWSEFWVQVTLESLHRNIFFPFYHHFHPWDISHVSVIFFKAWNYDLHLMDLVVIHRITHCKIRCDWQLVWPLNNGSQKPKRSTDSMKFPCYYCQTPSHQKLPVFCCQTPILIKLDELLYVLIAITPSARLGNDIPA